MSTKLKYNKYFVMFPKMAEQIPKFKSKRQVLQMKHRCLFLQTLMIGLCVFSGNIYSVQTATCPSSVPISAAITTEQSTIDLYFGDINSDFNLVQSCVASQDILIRIYMELQEAQYPIVSTTCTLYNQIRREWFKFRHNSYSMFKNKRTIKTSNQP